MTTTKTEPVRVSASLYVSLDYQGPKVQAYIAYDAEWRGQPAAVHMTGDRYTYRDSEDGDRLSDWRVYADTAKAGRYRTADRPDGELGGHLTDTARRRLSDQITPDALAWLASNDAAEQLRNAYYAACVRELRGARPYDFHRDAGHKLIERWGADMGAENVARFTVLADAWAGWVDAVVAAD